MIKRTLLLLTGIFLLTSGLWAQLPSDTLFDYTKLHRVDIEFEEEDFWHILESNYISVMGGVKNMPSSVNSAKEIYALLENSHKSASSEASIPYLAGKVTIDGETLDTVGVRIKGYTSAWPSTPKKSFKLDFNEFVKKQEYKGLKKLNLNNGFGDPSLQRDFISYYMMREAGVMAPRVAFTEVYINNRYWGLYTLVEQIDKTFLENYFTSGEGNLYKAVGWSNLEYMGDKLSDYAGSIGIKTNEETADGSDWVRFVKSLHELQGQAFTDSIQKLFYMDYYFKVMAVDIISKNWDSYLIHGRNFYLYNEPESDLFYWIPWDYNFSWGGDFQMMGGWSNDCLDYYDFSYDTVGTTANYTLQVKLQGLYNLSLGVNDIYKEWWDFSGDDTTITITDSTVVVNGSYDFGEEGIYAISVGGGYDNDCYLNKSEKIILIDSSLVKCPSIITMDRPYEPQNMDFDRVYERDAFCCDCQWDKLCERWLNYFPGEEINDMEYPINFQPSEKTLVSKILANQAYKERYYDAFKFVLDSVFNAEKLVAMIEANTDLIRNSVYTDTNLIFTINEFENDIDAVCKGSYQISSITRIIKNRKKGLDKEFEALNYHAQPLEKAMQRTDVVVNEFLASRSENNSEYKSDWIELYNNTDDILRLNDVWLSDRKDTLKYKLPETTIIKPDGFLVIYADNKENKAGLHANFKLSGNGEDILLYSEKYETLDILSYGPQLEDSSMARFPDGTGNFINMYPTPNNYNVEPPVVGIKNKNIAETVLLAYPNPASSIITLDANEFASFSVELFNVLGKKVLSQQSYGSQIQVSVSELPNGIYVLKAEHGVKQYTSKVMVKH